MKRADRASAHSIPAADHGAIPIEKTHGTSAHAKMQSVRGTAAIEMPSAVRKIVRLQKRSRDGEQMLVPKSGRWNKNIYISKSKNIMPRSSSKNRTVHPPTTNVLTVRQRLLREEADLSDASLAMMATDVVFEFRKRLDAWLASDMILGSQEYKDLERFLWDEKIGLLRFAERCVTLDT
jgi:hypothetical protein